MFYQLQCPRSQSGSLLGVTTVIIVRTVVSSVRAIGILAGMLILLVLAGLFLPILLLLMFLGASKLTEEDK